MSASTPDDPVSHCIEASSPVHGLGLHFVIDDSLAMVFPQDLWTPLAQALAGFASTERAAELALGAHFFQGTCDAAAYAQPELPLAPAGEQQALFAEIMSGRAHGPGAATALALEGAIEHARTWSIEQNRRAALVLITGSAPTGCAMPAQRAADAAADGLASDPPVATYVLAMRARSGLDAIAQAGGTDASITAADPGAQDALLATLEGVADRAKCEIALPASAAPYLPDRVNVVVTGGGSSSFVPMVGDGAECDASGGFYYDDPQAPKRILLCPETCAGIGPDDRVEIAYGCPTVVR